MASVAVFVALGGGAYAAVQVNGKDIKNHTITGKKIKRQHAGQQADQGEPARRGAERVAGQVRHQGRLGRHGGVSHLGHPRGHGDHRHERHNGRDRDHGHQRDQRHECHQRGQRRQRGNAGRRSARGILRQLPGGHHALRRRLLGQQLSRRGGLVRRLRYLWQRRRAPAHAQRAGCLHDQGRQSRSRDSTTGSDDRRHRQRHHPGVRDAGTTRASPINSSASLYRCVFYRTN